MKITKKMQDAINEQINAELYSSYMYLSMAAYLESNNLSGMATWMKLQAKEEIEHAMKFFGFVYERGGEVILKPIAGPKTKWESALDVFQNGYKHEQHVTELIHNLVKLADELKDFSTKNFLQWYVKEQVEEENNALGVVEKLKMIKDNKQGLMMIDAELGKRKAD